MAGRSAWYRSLLLLIGPLLGMAALADRVSAAEAPAPAGSTIEIFVRKAGSPPAFAAVQKEAPRTFELAKLALADVRHGDVQYDARVGLRGIRLEDLLAQYQPPATADLAILHFANGMAVPLPFRDAVVMRRLDPFIATAIVDGTGTAPLPALGRRVDGYRDVKAITFGGNKLSVNARFHPEVGEERSAEFSPWIFVDTLLSIELVRADAYYKQFTVTDAAEVAAGLKVYRQACQSCHGARKLGGGLGTDFADPTPVVKRLGVGRLLFHILYRPASEVERGAQMPAVSFVTEEEARRLYVWLQAVAEKPLRPYAP